jgi:hypothetical protein
MKGREKTKSSGSHLLSTSENFYRFLNFEAATLMSYIVIIIGEIIFIREFCQITVYHSPSCHLKNAVKNLS